MRDGDAIDDDDLLRPVLGPEDDLRRFGRPFRPTSLTYVAFFCGPLSAGIFFALNWARLGVRRFGWRTLCLFVAVFLFSDLGSALWYGARIAPVLHAPRETVALEPKGPHEKPWNSAVGLGEDQERLRARAVREANSIDRVVRRILALVPALWIAVRQGRRFRAYDMHDGKPATVWIWALLLGIGEGFASGRLTLLFIAWLGGS
ncbi:MAG: hypothetical protein U1F36_08850 [Planctomycetota bacterium]